MKYLSIFEITYRVKELGLRSERKLSPQFSEKPNAEKWLEKEEEKFLSRNCRDKTIKMKSIIAINEEESTNNYYDALYSLVFK